MSETAVTGLAELGRVLDELPVKFQRNVLRGALRAGAKVQLREARRAVPVAEPGATNARLYGGYAGALRDSLRVGTKVQGSTVRATVKAGSKVAYYAAMVEGGTRPHEIKPKARRSLFFAGLLRELVQHPGAKAKPFLRPALENTIARTLEAVAAYIRRRLAKAGIETPGE